MLENVWRAVDYRLDILRVTGGAHVEVVQLLFLYVMH
jgi:hypothetical protein